MRSVLLTLFSLAITFQSYSQCTPDPNLVGNNIYFAPANSQYVSIGGVDYTILPEAETGKPYSEVLQFKIPADTTVGGFQATIDYLKVLPPVGLPPGFQVNCNPSGCLFPGGTHGCGELQGTGGPADSILLKVPFELKVVANGQSVVTTDTIRNIVFVTRAASIGLEEAKNVFDVALFPNPASNYINLKINYVEKNLSLSIINSAGIKVFENAFEGKNDKLDIFVDISTYPKGIYFYSLISGTKIYQNSFVVKQ